jgi:hypothetical protein
MEKNFKKKIIKNSLVVLETSLIFGFLLVFFSNFSWLVFAGIGEPDVVVKTNLTIGNVFPEILLVDPPEEVTLIPNSTKIVSCIAIIRDFNNISDLDHTYAELFDTEVSYFGDSDAGNHHYTNSSCEMISNFGSYKGFDEDELYLMLANCTFYLQYYSNPGIDSWNCTVVVNDSSGWNATATNTTTVNELLAIGLPDVIDYGLVNATFVSEERVANVTNFGNVILNLSLSGYARTEGDNLSMNCSLGSIGEIPIWYERYNLSEPTAGDLNLVQFQNTYLNLTSSPIVKRFELDYKQDDTPALSLNQTYWRIYVPLGVAGTCQGNIIFGATTDLE